LFGTLDLELKMQKETLKNEKKCSKFKEKGLGHKLKK
jgi:hypothetical protein